jgi:hypothetical protein
VLKDFSKYLHFSDRDGEREREKMPSFRAEKLRVNLRLSINRLKLLEKKKTETAMKARREIADYMKSGRIERARIRVSMYDV